MRSISKEELISTVLPSSEGGYLFATQFELRSPRERATARNFALSASVLVHQLRTSVAGDSAKIRDLVSDTFQEIAQSDAALTALWVFDHRGQDKTWNVSVDSHRAWMLDAVAEANRGLK